MIEEEKEQEQAAISLVLVRRACIISGYILSTAQDNFLCT